MLLLVDKPTGYTSFDVIRKLKRLYRGEKIGHAGTLDPLATGILVIAIGKDTKRLKEFVGLDKTYIATIDFSKKSDTWDTDFWNYFEELKMKIKGRATPEGTVALFSLEKPIQDFRMKKVLSKQEQELYCQITTGERYTKNSSDSTLIQATNDKDNGQVAFLFYDAERVVASGRIDKLSDTHAKMFWTIIEDKKEHKKQVVLLLEQWALKQGFTKIIDNKDNSKNMEGVAFEEIVDDWGTLTHEQKEAPSVEEIEDSFTSILGTNLLPLTPFSAKKWKGKKLYEYARAGEPVLIDMPMELISFNILDYQFPVLQVELEVGSGTYIRSIAHRLGEQFGLGGILTGLKRTKVGVLSIS